MSLNIVDSSTIRILVAAFTISAAHAKADVAVVSEGRPMAVLSLSSREPATQYAAKQIARYVKAMTGAELETVSGDASGPRIELDDSAEGLAQEEFRIETKGDAVLLSGGSPRAALYAAYELLEHWGCGFWSPLNESVPKVDSLGVESKWKVSSKPAFAWRQVHSQYGYNINFKPKLRINGRMWTYPTPPELGGWESMAMGQSLAGVNHGEAE